MILGDSKAAQRHLRGDARNVFFSAQGFDARRERRDRRDCVGGDAVGTQLLREEARELDNRGFGGSVRGR